MPRGIPGSAVKTPGAKPSLGRKLSAILDAADESALAEVDEEIAAGTRCKCHRFEPTQTMKDRLETLVELFRPNSNGDCCLMSMT